MPPDGARAAIWAIAALTAALVAVRPWRLPEAIWAVGGAALLVLAGLLPLAGAWAAVGKGLDVYLFLAGMMLLSEVARREGLFDALAAWAVNHARGSPRRLFALIYAAGVLVTAFLSNDATAVVLTPAVFAAAKRAKTDPLPHLFACALVANAASFVLPISNPANIVLWGDHTPPLARWLASFALPSLVAIAATYAALRWTSRAALAGACERDAPAAPLTRGGLAALASLALAGLVLVTVSALGRPLGLPTFVLGAATATGVLVVRRASPLPLLRGVTWSILPLVAGLFVVVAGLERTGAVAAIAAWLRDSGAAHPAPTAWAAGGLIAFGSNLVNNLPAGLTASAALAQAHPPRAVADSLLIGVDLGPNLSVTGSLATILWLAAIRRDGEDVSYWRFLKVGALAMPPALLLALAARLALGG